MVIANRTQLPMKIIPAEWRVGRFMTGAGFVCGILYAVIGLFVDLLTVGVNLGAALAFLAIAGMPIIFGAVGVLAGGLGAVVLGVGVFVSDRWRR